MVVWQGLWDVVGACRTNYWIYLLLFGVFMLLVSTKNMASQSLTLTLTLTLTLMASQARSFWTPTTLVIRNAPSWLG